MKHTLSIKNAHYAGQRIEIQSDGSWIHYRRDYRKGSGRATRSWSDTILTVGAAQDLTEYLGGFGLTVQGDVIR